MSPRRSSTGCSTGSCGCSKGDFFGLAFRISTAYCCHENNKETGVCSKTSGHDKSLPARSDGDSLAWREGFIRTSLERDIPQLGITIQAAAMRSFWTMLARYRGQTWNASELGRAMGLSDKAVRSYLDILAGTFMIRQLQPWHENIQKRQVKSPKIYLRDSGLLHGLLGPPDFSSLVAHPRVGASLKGFVIEQVLDVISPTGGYFWATRTGAEIDLLLIIKGKSYGIEVRFN